ncbi:MAG: ABC transporter ATP-binding protein [Desulfobacterales bacterium]
MKNHTPQVSSLSHHTPAPSQVSAFSPHPSEPSQVSGLSPQPSNDVLIRVQNVSKKFCRDLKRSLWYGMKDLGNELLGRSHGGGDGELRKDEFWAVKDVSFELKRGECLGLIGRNGAGKTTLLRMLNGLIKPDSGRIEMRGRIGALIALGAGFNPILTGRENIYVNAAVLGLSKKETDTKFEEIVEFAELGDFIDAPVQSYSSGMAVRLGFAVASSLNQDILILDEILAVGDVGFRTKCYNRIYDLAKKTAVIFVSHSMSQIARLSTRTMVMDTGRTVFDGDIASAIEVYEGEFSKQYYAKWELSPGVSLDYVKINGEKEIREVPIQAGDPLIAEIRLRLPPYVNLIETSLSIHQLSLDLISHINNVPDVELSTTSLGPYIIITINVPSMTLSSGKKLLTLTIRNGESNEILVWASTAWVLNVSSHKYVPAPVYHEASFMIEKADTNDTSIQT